MSVIINILGCIIAIFLIVYKITILFIFGKAFYQSKGCVSKIIIFLLFFFYCVSNLATAPNYNYHHGLGYGYELDSRVISRTDYYLQKTETFIMKTFESLTSFLPRDLGEICFLILLAPITTMTFLHFVYSSIYIVIVGSLWAAFLRANKE